VSLGYPDRAAERQLLVQGDARQLSAGMRPLVTAEEVIALQQEAASLHAAEPLLEYVLDLVEFTRSAPEIAVGLSPRAGLSLLAAARAWAFVHGRRMVTPDDVQAVLLPVVGHRLRDVRDRRELAPETLRALFDRVPIP
ncbi:MAG: AAA family ATPase, partial [Oceanidesulfovibrio sp.]